MKKKTQKLLAAVLSVFVAFALVIVPQTSAPIAGMAQPAKYAKKINVAAGMAYELNMGKRLKGASKVKVTSSNKKIVAHFGKWDPKRGGKYLLINAAKKGAATLTIKVTKKGKTKKYKCKVKVNKYKNPIKKFMIGSKNVAKAFKKYPGTGSTFTKGGKYKVAVTPASGWKVKKIEYKCYSKNTGKTVKTAFKNKKSGTITVKASEDYIESIYITLYNKSKKMKMLCYYGIEPVFDDYE